MELFKKGQQGAFAVCAHSSRKRTSAIGTDRLRPTRLEAAASVGPDRLSINHSRYFGRGRGLMAGKIVRSVVAHTSIAAGRRVPTR
jgi:hypothetical protein